MVAWTCWGGLELSIKNQFIIADSCLLGKRDCFSSFFSGGSKKGLPGALWGLRGAFSKGPPWWSKCHRPTGLVEPVRCTQRRGIACQRSPGTDSHPSHVDPPCGFAASPLYARGHSCLRLPCVRGGQSRLRRDRRDRRGSPVCLSPQNDTRPAHRRSRQQTGGVVLPGICGLGPSQREAPSEPPTGWAAGDGFVTLRGSHKFTTLWAGVLSYRPVTVRGCKNRKNRKRKIPHRSRKKR